MSETMTATDRYEAVKLKLLKLRAQNAQYRRAYWVDGVSTPMHVRVELEAEIAEMEVERHLLRIESQKEKLAARIQLQQMEVQLQQQKHPDWVITHSLVAASPPPVDPSDLGRLVA